MIVGSDSNDNKPHYKLSRFVTARFPCLKIYLQLQSFVDLGDFKPSKRRPLSFSSNEK